MKLYEILIPTVSNEGRPFKTRHHRVWDKKAQLLSHGGLTIFPKTIKGKWVDNETNIEYNDSTLPVRLVCDEQEMSEIADFTAKHYKQLAIMYYVVSDDVKIVKYDSKTFRRVKDVPHFC